ncbi:MAG: preprotein translocase subunit SecE [Oligoflexia bacterium]|nr:preprotein translocase subunit SecE [Oligoflexia bacterium]
MTEDNKKIVTISFVLGAVLVGYVSRLLLQVGAQSVSVLARWESNDYVSNFFPVLVGLAVFLALQLNSKAQEFGDSVVSELKKVTWPSKNDTGVMTIVVVITLIISGVLMGMYDAVAAYLVRLLLGS